MKEWILVSDTLKEMILLLLGLIVGGAAFIMILGKRKNKTKEQDVRINQEKKQKKFDDLVANQSFVELLTVKELSSWFHEHRSQFNEKIKMLIIMPTEEILTGLGFSKENKLDAETQLLQMFYNEETGEALKIRLISFAEIDSNLQARLIEDDGMIVVTD